MLCGFQTEEPQMKSIRAQMKSLDLAITVPVAINWMCFYSMGYSVSFISDSMPLQEEAGSPMF